ncbi:MAG: thiolase family protein [Sulfobacillus thermosulfidooxidans]|uniref:Beta-ketoadipyl CoA thiolase n=1 Tax=Sulfobacillus thermotolerans TaxID=338644 RepID=A0ABM6RQU9_9FIRM|nr:thiolase family protein [Sulfobacillus sp. hq2]AUW93827.1 beta-ketoadipyl CoA thiolase [Sulfobacillus thermotolerans]POB11360.1 acetyl-CoA C-acyltransferase [Sulfobacillus sp. hq2]PSR36959.1 MAG: thiolase family protein [Sulfobacillus thermosulfidooxidans]
MREVVVVAAKRTPIGRHHGVLKDVRPDDLAALVLKALLEQTGLDPREVDDVLLGAANQAGEDNRNVARMALLLAGFPVEVPGATVNRLCGSSLEAVNRGYQAIFSGEADVIIAGGVESMTRAPFVLPKFDTAFPVGNREIFDTTIGWRMVNPRLAAQYYPYSMGETAENLAERFGLTREEQDAWALRSHQRAVLAQTAGRFADELIPVPIENPKTHEVKWVTQDEHPRPDTSLEKLAQLKPAFRPGGTVTAGNSSGINDGAAAVMLMEESVALRHNLEPLAYIRGGGVAGVDPAIMGYGPVPATQRALQRHGWTLDEIERVELNEAFAAQVLAVLHDLPFDRDIVNPEGGAIALGHPLGASGARILTTLIYGMRRQGARRGVATMCIGVGQGITTLVERP